MPGKDRVAKEKERALLGVKAVLGRPYRYGGVWDPVKQLCVDGTIERTKEERRAFADEECRKRKCAQQNAKRAKERLLRNASSRGGAVRKVRGALPARSSQLSLKGALCAWRQRKQGVRTSKTVTSAARQKAAAERRKRAAPAAKRRNANTVRMRARN
eukprot:7370364-Prymnesium_polylepis.2